jgi:hypothetical protein
MHTHSFSIPESLRHDCQLIRSCRLSRTLGVVLYLDVGVGKDRIARIGHNAGKFPSVRGLGDRHTRDRRQKQEAH